MTTYLRRKELAALFVLAVLMCALTGCGAKGFHLATVSVVSAHATASVVQDTADAFTCGAATAPSEPSCVTVDVRKAIAAKLSPAFGLTGRIAAEVKAWPPNTPLPPTIPGLLAQVSALIRDVLALLPSDAQARVQALIGGAQ